MKRCLHLISACALALFASACTQDPAEVDYKGDEFFGRVHEGSLDNPNHETFSENSPRLKQEYARPVEQAKVQSVGVSDLPPPTPQSTAPAAEPTEKDTTAPAPAQKAAPAKKNDKLTFIWPVADGKLISHFGPGPNGRSNDGINVGVAEGEPIWATAGGTVVYAGSDLKGYGNMVIIRHNGGWMTAYAHARSLSVKKDAAVKQGDIIGYVGMTGGVKSPQLHFAMRNGRTPVDPELYLPKNTQ